MSVGGSQFPFDTSQETLLLVGVEDYLVKEVTFGCIFCGALVYTHYILNIYCSWPMLVCMICLRALMDFLLSMVVFNAFGLVLSFLSVSDAGS